MDNKELWDKIVSETLGNNTMSADLYFKVCMKFIEQRNKVIKSEIRDIDKIMYNHQIDYGFHSDFDNIGEHLEEIKDSL